MDPLFDDLLDMFPHEVTVEDPPTVNYEGDSVTPGAIRILNAHVSGKITRVSVDGKSKKSSVTAVFDGVYGLTVDHVYTLPSSFSPNQPKPIDVLKATDENGVHHETVYFE